MQNEAGDYEASWSQLTQLGHFCKTSEVAVAVLLLLSEEASLISGQTIGVDGGLF